MSANGNIWMNFTWEWLWHDSCPTCTPNFCIKAATDIGESKFKGHYHGRVICPNCMHTACNSMCFVRTAAVHTSKKQKYTIRNAPRVYQAAPPCFYRRVEWTIQTLNRAFCVLCNFGSNSMFSCRAWKGITERVSGRIFSRMQSATSTEDVIKFFFKAISTCVRSQMNQSVKQMSYGIVSLFSCPLCHLLYKQLCERKNKLYTWRISLSSRFFLQLRKMRF